MFPDGTHVKDMLDEVGRLLFASLIGTMSISVETLLSNTFRVNCDSPEFTQLMHDFNMFVESVHPWFPKVDSPPDKPDIALDRNTLLPNRTKRAQESRSWNAQASTDNTWGDFRALEDSFFLERYFWRILR